MQSFMIIQSTNNNLELFATVNCLGLLLFFFYKLVNLICKCGVTVVVLYMYCKQCFMLIEIVTVKGYGNIHSHRLRLVAIGYE